MTGVGIDLVAVPRIAESVQRFGDRFLRRVFTADEIAYAQASPTVRAARLAARFAAKEATIKALRVAPDVPMRWTDIEVQRESSGACVLALRGHAAAWAQHWRWLTPSLSLSHDGDYATAIVVL
ncbi:MAG: holo-ACP synthase [Gemmatimonadaceae bacterium]